MYKIGTEWLFDTKKYEGYRVYLSKKTGKIDRIIRAFKIELNGTEVKCLSDSNYEGDIPFGVIRKSSHLIELDRSGDLVKFESQIQERELQVMV